MSRRNTRILFVASVSTLLGALPALGRPNNAPVYGTLRTTLGPDQGYLAFIKTDPPLPLGEEVTGWTDFRTPGYYDGNLGPKILTKDRRIGYDRYDHFANVRNVIVEDANGIKASAANIERDFNLANEAYAQLGMSIVNAGNVNAVYNNVTFPVSPAEENLIRAANRAAAPTINNYYVRDFDSAGLRGVTYKPETGGANTALILRDARFTDTFAHEAGHFLIDNYRFADSAGGNQGHSSLPADLMCNGDDRTEPPMTAKSAGNDAPRKVGFTNGPNLGGLSKFDEGLSTPANFPGGPFDVKQGRAIYNTESDGTSYMQVTDQGNFAGDRADFDWVVDSWQIEDLGGRGDNHNYLPRENLYYHIAPINNSPHTDHQHSDNVKDWGELNYNGFTGNNFKYADVVSQIARFADMDIDGGNDWSERESALDYVIEFSADGTNWAAGNPIAIFKEGWTMASDAENYICRWESPVNATLLRVRAIRDGIEGHDGNTQIDAIIVSAFVPEPATASLLVLALPMLRRRR